MRLIQKDLETVNKAIEKVEKKAQTGIKEAKKYYGSYCKAREILENKQLLRKGNLDENSLVRLGPLQLLTLKPEFYIFNISEDSIGEEGIKDEILKAIDDDSPGICISAQIEEEINGLDDSEEQKEFRESLGLITNVLDKIIKCGYKHLGLITFFTANKNEAKAWTVRKGTIAVDAAEKVHSDFKEKFIRAEVIPVDLVIKHKSFTFIREKGLTKIKGKDYSVEDGDILLFKI